MSDFKPVNQPIAPASADPGEEFPFLHTISVVDRVVSVDKPELVQNNIRTETVTLNLDSEWDGLSCIINIGSGETPTSLIWSGKPVIIPAELMTDIGTLNVSVVGYGDDGAVRAVTKKADAMFVVAASGYVHDDNPVPDPTTILGQLVQAADNANQAADRFNQASEDIGDISDAVIDAKGYADAAKTSETNAASSATAASQSKTNAAASASAAKTSETNAAASATAAQQAVDGFGLEVGRTTTGDPGTDAAVEIEKQGTKYTANFTIPRGDKGADGVNENVPLGTTSGVVAQASDAYPALPRKVQVHGRTVENLCPLFNETNNNGVFFSTDSDGYITIKGTSTKTIFAQHPIINLQANTKVWIYVDSDFRSKGIANVYAQSSEWSMWADPNNAVSSTTKSATDGSLVISINSGVTVDTKIRIMLVASETEPDTSLFVPSGVHTVEPTKLEAVGKNLIYGWEAGSLDSVSGSDEGSLVEVRSSPSRVIPGMQYTLTVYKPSGFNKIRYYGLDGTYLGFNLVSDLPLSVVRSNVFTVPENVGSMRFVFTNTDNDKFTEMLPDMDSVVQLESGSKSTQWSLGQMTETNLPSDIGLADGDTLTIDRDGTTRIVHAEGEPTVLENVTLPELPAPTFNVYTTGGYVPPTVDVDYEKDVNLVIQGLEAKIASLQVADKTN